MKSWQPYVCLYNLKEILFKPLNPEVNDNLLYIVLKKSMTPQFEDRFLHIC